MRKPMLDTQMLSQQASRSCASRFQLQGSEKVKQTTGTNGRIPSGSFARYDRNTSSWKTYQPSLLTNTLEPYSDSWPKAGMIVDGIGYELQTLVRRIKGKGSGSWRTPASSDGEGGIMKMIEGKAGHYKLRDQVQPINQHAQPRMWATPQAQESGKKPIAYSKNGKRYITQCGSDFGMGLSQQVQMWPTPRATKVGGYSSKNFRPTLEQVANGGETTQQTPQMRLNPRWVEWLMGFPIGYSNLKHLEMHRFRLWWQQHGGC